MHSGLALEAEGRAGFSRRPHPERISTARLVLEPLSVNHAPSMVSVLAHPSLYVFTGGEAPSLDELQERYARQTVGHSADESQWWLNWILRHTATNESIGFVQATVQSGQSVQSRLVADIAWVISPAWQCKGCASEATTAMIEWLTLHEVDGETRWVEHAPRTPATLSVVEKSVL
nr:GNAT family N-acetyltransferase [Alpinimonas psychrophila]